jgi:hypothetical protein
VVSAGEVISCLGSVHRGFLRLSLTF